jgi:8-oxo-dGTP pyrophosphatase MutT (NUDIX family)
MIFKKLIGRIVYIFTYPLFRVIVYGTNRAYVMLIYKDQAIISQNTLGWGNEWCLPGGGIKKGENPKIAAAREIKEELNIRILPSKLIQIGKKSYISRFGNNYVIYKYDLKYAPKISNSLEILQSKEVNFKHIKSYKLNEVANISLSLLK